MAFPLPFSRVLRKSEAEERLESFSVGGGNALLHFNHCNRYLVAHARKWGGKRTYRLRECEKVSGHDEVLATSVEPRGEVLALCVHRLQSLAHALRIRAFAVYQLVGGSNQTKHRLLHFLQ